MPRAEPEDFRQHNDGRALALALHFFGKRHLNILLFFTKEPGYSPYKLRNNPDFMAQFYSAAE